MANSYLSRTNGSAATLGTKYTVSVWLKRSGLANSAYHYIISHDAGGNPRTHIRFQDTTDDLSWYIRDASGTGTSLTTSRLFRDTSAWYHIVCAYDSTQSTASNRQKIYVNGVQETLFSSSGYVAQDTVSPLSENSNAFKIGSFGGSASNYFDGYMSHFVFVDGLALTPTSFGETDSTSGIWKFKAPSGITFGNNGYHLKFENSGALGTDSSGNSNTFTVNGNLKQALDTPSNTYSTMNPLDNYYFGGTFINGNNTVTGSSSSYTYCTSTLGVSSGKWYVEAKLSADDSNAARIGVVGRPSTATNNGIGDRQDEVMYQRNGNLKINGTATSSWGSTWAVNDIIGIALDLDNNKIYFSKNGTFVASGNPSTGANGQTITAASSTIDGFYRFGFGDNNSTGSCTFQYNFGNGFFGTTAITSAGSNGNGSLFEYDVPTGFYAINTKNINTYG